MRLLKYSELAQELGLSIRYLQKCVQGENLPCIHFGKAVRFDPVKVAEWVYNRNQKLNNSECKKIA